MAIDVPTAGPSHGSRRQPPESNLKKITGFIFSALSPNEQACIEADEGLKQCEEGNFGGFLFSLSFLLHIEDNPQKIRKFAGMRLKKSLDPTKESLCKRWLNIDDSLRSNVKTLLLGTLGSSSSEVGDISAQVIAQIATIEIPISKWSELHNCLLENIIKQGSSEQATLKAIGYIFDRLFHNDLYGNCISRDAVKGMEVTKQSSVLLAAVIRNPQESIMKVACDAALDKKKAGFEVLVSVASTYYEALGPYMGTFFKIMHNFTDEDNGVEAIEFWIRICEQELWLTANSSPHYRLIELANDYIVPKLLEALLKEGGNDICRLSRAGGKCLGLFARTVGDSIIPLVYPFALVNLEECDGVSRGAGAYAFGSILEGPSVEELSRLVPAVLHLLIDAMGDENSLVKETARWTISRIFKFLPYVISPAELERIIEALVDSIKESVTENFCEAIYYLAQGGGLSVLSPYVVDDIITCLTTTSVELMIDGDSKLRSVVYKTLKEVVRCSDTCPNIMQNLLRQMMSALKQTTEGDGEKQEDQQALLCGVLQVIIQKLSSSTHKTKPKPKPSISQDVDDEIMMPLLMKVFDHGSSTLVQREAMVASGVLVCAIGLEFNKYMVEFAKCLRKGLQDSKNYQVYTASVGVVSDICRALGDKMLPYCDDIMELLNISSRDLHLHPSVKPAILTCLGDMARAIEKSFEKHVDPVMRMLKEAVEVCAQLDDVNDKNTVKQLKMSIFEGYLGILPLLKTVEGDSMSPHARQLLTFIEMVVKDPHRDESLGKATVALLGDLAIAVGPTISVFNLTTRS